MNERTEAVVFYLRKTTGLVFSTEQLSGLEDFLRERFSILHISEPAEYIARLEDPAEFLEAVDRLTVKETFFYRHEAQFDAFMEHLLPVFLASAAEEKRPVRLWCAGCCTGEEPYTLAILAAEAGCLDRIEILATDIHKGYLEAAMSGVYSRRALEKLSPDILGKYFSKEGDSFLLREDIRRKVDFKCLNLGGTFFPSFLNGTAGLDAVFCRNVLIYFEKARVREIIIRFTECLRGGGVLALGHSEMLPQDWPLSVHMAGEAFFYRPGKEQPAEERLPPVKAAKKIERIPAPAPPRDEEPAALLLKAESLADAGHAAEAASLCRKVIKQDYSLEKAHYLLGLLELSRPEKALEHFKKAVYLNAGHLQARLHLAQCEEKLGRTADAAREYRNLQRLASARPPGELLDAVEGITCGMLALIAENAVKKHQGPDTGKNR